MTLSPLWAFPALYLLLAIVLAFDAARRFRAGLVAGWQLTLTLLMKAVPIAAFSYVVAWRMTTGDDIGAYLMFVAVAMAAGILGVAWLLFDLVGLGLLHPIPSQPAPRAKAKVATKAKTKAKPKAKPKAKR
jgi:hypothetical protein